MSGIFDAQRYRYFFTGTSHAATHLRAAALARGLPLAEDHDHADVVFVSEDTPTDAQGNRDLGVIMNLLVNSTRNTVPLVLTSAVPPGFTRKMAFTLGRPIWHQAETLRIVDAEIRARYPEMMVVGYPSPEMRLPAAYMAYLMAFDCPIIGMSLEDAEYSKIAINVFLAAQVDTTNRLAAGAAAVGANWESVRRVLSNDRRIGPHAYLNPGRWQDSRHLLRDDVSLREILGEKKK